MEPFISVSIVILAIVADPFDILSFVLLFPLDVSEGHTLSDYLREVYRILLVVSQIANARFSTSKVPKQFR